MNEIEDFVLLGTGSRVFYRCLLPDSKFDILIIGSHGLTAHSGVYLPVGEVFAKSGIAFCMHDQRGHGRTASVDDKGYVNSFLDYVSDLEKFADYIKWRIGGKKIIYWGHSMGGLIVLLASIFAKDGVDAVIALAPALEIPLKTSHRIVLKMLSKISPRYKLKLRDHNPQKQETFEKIKDPHLILSAVTARLINEMITAASLFWRNTENISVPVLIIHGEKDNVIPVEASKKAFEKIKSPYKKLLIYSNFGHNLFLEPGGEKILEDILKWIQNLSSDKI